MKLICFSMYAFYTKINSIIPRSYILLYVAKIRSLFGKLYIDKDSINHISLGIVGMPNFFHREHLGLNPSSPLVVRNKK